MKSWSPKELDIRADQRLGHSEDATISGKTPEYLVEQDAVVQFPELPHVAYPLHPWFPLQLLFREIDLAAAYVLDVAAEAVDLLLGKEALDDDAAVFGVPIDKLLSDLHRVVSGTSSSVSPMSEAPVATPRRTLRSKRLGQTSPSVNEHAPLRPA
jgi:hypothetical protein